MTLQDKLIQKYGNPLVNQLEFERKHMVSYKYPSDILSAIPQLGASVYCNKDFVLPYENALRSLIDKGVHREITSNDQCFMPRLQRGSQSMISIHSWALAIDLNPADNPIYSTREQCIARGLKPFTEKFVSVFRDLGWVCGADFAGRPDIMHFQFTNHII